MSVPDDRAARRLQEEGEKIERFFRSLTPAQWTAPVYQVGSRWSMHDLLAHFVSAESAFFELLEDIRRGGQGAQDGFDIDRFNEDEVASLRDRPGAELLDAFRSARDRTIALISGLTPEDRRRRGHHPWLGDASLENMIQMIYRHNMLHMRDARKALQTGEPAPPRDSAPGRDRAG